MLRVKGWLPALLVLGCTGCSTIGYYHQSISGHFSLISKQERIVDIVNDSTRDEKLIEQLILTQQLRSFASSTLKLPQNDSYLSYIQLDKPYVTWNVFAAPEFSIDLQQWCFPIIDCVSYRGYFDEKDARSYAARLTTQGLDVYVAGVPAYSTLGWFDDPLLSTMLNRGEIATASYIFHELAHQQLYIKGDSAFNEAFATTVEELGVHRWLQQQLRVDALNEYKDQLEQKSVFSNFIKTIKEELEQLYAQELAPGVMRSAKLNKITDTRKRFKDLSRQNERLSHYETWVPELPNNAQLGAISLYRELVPDFSHIFELCNGNFERFYKRVVEISQGPHKQRKLVLKTTNKC